MSPRLHGVSIAIVALSIASACSSSLPRVSPTQPVPSGNQIGATDRQGESSNHPRDSAGVSAAVGAQAEPKVGDTLAPALDVDRSQADIDTALRKRGYKPTSYRGERVYCRSEALTGSNLKSKVCLTAKQIEDQERAAKDILNGNRPAGCLPKPGCN
jgi:hypothetical protein